MTYHHGTRKVSGLLTAIATAVLMLSAEINGAAVKNTKGFSVFHDRAVPRTVHPTFPKYSDVSMRTLTIRDVPQDDPMSIFWAAPQFHITRIDWSYIWLTSRELEAVKKLQGLGYSYCGSAAQHIPCWIGDQAPVDWQEKIIMTNIQGNPSIMAFIRPWKNPQLIGDISNPAYYDGHLEYYKKVIDAGCDSLQRDAANHHYLAVTTTGGGFTKTGVAGFTKWLAEKVDTNTLAKLEIDDIKSFDYKEYLLAKGAPCGDDFSYKYNCPLKKYWYKYWEDVSVEFFGRLIGDCKAYAKRDIPISVNNTSFQRWDRLHLLFDFGMSELMMVSANPEHLWKRAMETENVGKFQVIGSAKLLGLEVLPQEKTAMDNKVIATIYANGGLAQVPWDTFEQTKDGAGRFFGAPVDYAPIFGFIRGIAPYLDGYDRAYDYSTGGILTDGIGADAKPLQITDSENEVCAFVRVNTKNTDSPIVVHLIDWGKSQVIASKKGADEVWELATGEKIYDYVKGMENLKRSAAERFKLVFNQDAFDVPADSLRFTLLTPLPYDPQQHNAAEKNKDYSTLVSEQSLSPRHDDNGTIYLDIPALHPWGVLLIGRK